MWLSLPRPHIPLYPLAPDVRTALTLTLQSGKKRITKELLALCEYNVNSELSHDLQMKNPVELELLAMEANLGLKKWCTKRIPFPPDPLVTSDARKRKRSVISTEAHKLFRNGIIILEPLGDHLAIFDTPITSSTTNPLLTSYDIIFSYLPSHPTSSEWDLTSFSTLTPLSTLQLTEESDSTLEECRLIRHPLRLEGESRMARDGRMKYLESGTRVTLSTSDPIRWPLPHPDLLRLHAGLSRVVRCSGAGGGGEVDEWETDDELVDEEVVGSELDYTASQTESVGSEEFLTQSAKCHPDERVCNRHGVMAPGELGFQRDMPSVEKVLGYLSGLSSPRMSSPTVSSPLA
ncbi:hypothetical protein BGX38DRAFT_1192771 [Terfezia claveryi]|nr:hypothetical protein BGX38DRAFT_1192771 [Terfezia claveryi]